MKPEERSLAAAVYTLPYPRLREAVVEMIRNCLAQQRGNIASLWPAKLAKLNGLPSHPALLIRIAAVLEEIDEVQVDGVVWEKTPYRPCFTKHRGITVLFKRKGVPLDW